MITWACGAETTSGRCCHLPSMVHLEEVPCQGKAEEPHLTFRVVRDPKEPLAAPMSPVNGWAS